MKKDNQTLLKGTEELTLMNTKFTADQQVFECLIFHWQSKGEEIKGRIDQRVSENERLYSENQPLIESNVLLVIDGQNLQAVQEQLDMAMTQLNRHADALETAIQERSDRESTVHSLMGKLSGSKKTKEQQATQFKLTLGQQNKQIKKPLATLARARSHEPSGLRKTGDDSVLP
jgi:DNA-binding transcriptional MerR regulator